MFRFSAWARTDWISAIEQLFMDRVFFLCFCLLHFYTCPHHETRGSHHRQGFLLLVPPFSHLSVFHIIYAPCVWIENNTRAEKNNDFSVHHNTTDNRQNCNKIKWRSLFCLFVFFCSVCLHTRFSETPKSFPSSTAAMRHPDLAFATQSSPLCSLSATSFISGPVTWQGNMTSQPVMCVWQLLKKRRLSPLWSRRPSAVQEGT